MNKKLPTKIFRESFTSGRDETTLKTVQDIESVSVLRTYITARVAATPRVAIEQQYHKRKHQPRGRGQFSVFVQHGVQQQQIQQTSGNIHIFPL